jgi:hypothetical protein
MMPLGIVPTMSLFPTSRVSLTQRQYNARYMYETCTHSLRSHISAAMLTRMISW